MKKNITGQRLESDVSKKSLKLKRYKQNGVHSSRRFVKNEYIENNSPLSADVVITDTKSKIVDIPKGDIVEFIRSINDALNRGIDFKTILKTITEEIRLSYSCLGTALYFQHNWNNSLKLENIDLPKANVPDLEKIIGRELQKMEIPLKPDSFYGEIINSGQPGIYKDDTDIKKIVLDHADSKKQQKYCTAVLKKFPIKSILVSPLKTDSGVIGLFVIASDRTISNSTKNNLIALVSLLTTVIVRKKRDEQIQYQADLLESVSDAIISTDFEYNILSWNKTAEEVYGYTSDEAIGKNIDRLMRTEIPYGNTDNVAKALQNRGNWRGEVIQQHKNGSRLHVLTSVTCPASFNGNPMAMVTVNRNMTEYVKAEEAISESNERFRTLIAATTDAIMVFSSYSKQFIEVNAACEELYGYTQKEFKKLKLTDISAEPEKAIQSIHDTLEGDLKRIAIRYHIKKDGTVFPVELSAGKFVLNGRIVLCGIVRDITERVEFEHQLKQANEKLKEDQRQLLQKNVTLREVLNQIEAEKHKVGEQIDINVRKIILPLINKMENKIGSSGSEYIDQLRKNLTEITSPFIHEMKSAFSNLTPRELQICRMIINGLSTKEIALSLDISVETVRSQRKTVRSKLGISGDSTNLRSYLEANWDR